MNSALSYLRETNVDSSEMAQIKSVKRLLEKLKAGHVDARTMRGKMFGEEEGE
jgi:hypothetical protein